jgi:hypothetical protein
MSHLAAPLSVSDNVGMIVSRETSPRRESDNVRTKFHVEHIASDNDSLK